jgi:hypothetical protein
VRFQPDLTAHRGKLLSQAGLGQPVFAGSFLRKREIVLDAALSKDRRERSRILVHELFHFVWLRFGNSARTSWTHVLEAEFAARARGELGWSSEWRKQALSISEGRPWREYACESFCDTAAWKYAQVGEHKEFTLAERWRGRRSAWFEEQIEAREYVRI